MIEIKNLTKRYGRGDGATTALDNVSLTFEDNKIYGLLGRNGAGKTTLLNVITGRIFADGGAALADGASTRENDTALGSIYLMSEKSGYPDNMRVREGLRWTATFYPEYDAAFADSLCRRFELDTKKRVKSLSTGYASIFKLIVALSSGAKHVLLDEPVLGLDANHRDLFYRVLLERYAEKPSTVVVSTHLVEEVSAVIEDVVIIKRGKLLLEQSRDELLASGYTVAGFADRVNAFAQGRRVIGEDALGGLKTAYIMGARPEVTPDGLELSRIDLQKLFVQLTND
ncbi:MAG: ABC transporter ATP-binding protein [Oscillospiraceae bacterium]|jgi:ABC-2 type transport system ATP-binding protein|nr:ABC transporter ATP-binding protein [Oscillospiraceae bacterium]